MVELKTDALVNPEEGTGEEVSVAESVKEAQVAQVSQAKKRSKVGLSKDELVRSKPKDVGAWSSDEEAAEVAEKITQLKA